MLRKFGGSKQEAEFKVSTQARLAAAAEKYTEKGKDIMAKVSIVIVIFLIIIIFIVT